MTMKILLPVDGSDCAQRAVEQLLAHCNWFCEAPEIHLLHVHPPIPDGRVLAHVGKETLHAYYREESEVQLAAAQVRLGEAGAAFVTHIHVGQPAEVIVRLAEELACALIVMGTHGRSALAGLLMGSVATRVLHLATCPVMLIK